MISLNRYEEFAPGMGLPSMRESFAPAPYDGMGKIASYLENGQARAASPGITKDIFTGETVPGEQLIMTDGEYVWHNDLAYYVRKYNLRLPKEFEGKVLGIKED